MISLSILGPIEIQRSSWAQRWPCASRLTRPNMSDHPKI